MNDQLEMLPGTNRDTSRSQYFTPRALAEKVVQWAGIADPNRGPYSQPYRVLEPSAGNGALVRPLVAAGAIVDVCEIDERYHAELLELGAWLQASDFLECIPNKTAWDLCVMNPPYHDDHESKFILHALKFAPRVVGIFRADVFYTVSRGENLWSNVRPTRVAFCSRRPWKGAETDYCVLELVQRREFVEGITPCTVEWWPDRWA